MYEQLALYIDGNFTRDGERQQQDVINPATGVTIGKLPHATRADLDQALEAAQNAFETWRKSSPLDRSKVLRRVAELARERVDGIARNITMDGGKTLAEAKGEVMGAAEHAEWHAEECRRTYGRVIPPRAPHIRQITVREPVGVCAAFTPWNFPFVLSMRKIAAAIGAGCTLVMKGPEESPSAVVALARLFHDAGLPPGCLNIVWGIPSEVSEYLITSPIVRKVSFTGSIPVGKHLAALAAARMKRITMELGGHSPVLVFEDAEIEKAAQTLAILKMRHAGQVCMAPSRFYVHEKVYDRFLDGLTKALSTLTVGDGLLPDTNMGPLVRERRVHAMETLVSDSVERGAKIIFGGERLKRDGFFFPPTVMTEVSDTAKVMMEEPFGPVVPVARFSDTDDVLRRANSVPYGLASYVFTGSLKTSRYVSSNLEAGMVNINHFGIALAETPMGGVKESGIGSEGGTETFEGYFLTKFISEAS
ncbi:NAD-dependent succinate-semialdehyde dehydrogenase [Noviherbaspirillum pedocola]|uniref:NAD-dependent succinate-semialdehyde dehydrogenase n=1 Tax=Noviherbaspirillum pedocola TaxID=2801341 RepID=A0A934SZG0_9BURK|nr:NAD-dependent succinate-semialdehyde dehydrogenase [Noviherbaspirillum pedocola]MBK4739350.1 NAD-dependent succinate-semialdehyde dehydrogenase [Noviherbaspirillum pedocola]